MRSSRIPKIKSLASLRESAFDTKSAGPQHDTCTTPKFRKSKTPVVYERARLVRDLQDDDLLPGMLRAILENWQSPIIPKKGVY
jgi:hypothetical protein